MHRLGEESHLTMTVQLPLGKDGKPWSPKWSLDGIRRVVGQKEPKDREVPASM